MTQHLSGSNGRGKRRGGGFRHAGGTSAHALRRASAQRGFAETRVLTDWPTILGAGLSAVCRPVKISYAGKGGLGAELIVHAEGPRAPEVQMMRQTIIDKINAYYGYRAISRIRVTQIPAHAQTAPMAGLAETSRGFDRTGAPDPATTRVSDADIAKVDAAVSGVEDDALKQALARLGANIATRGARRSNRRR